MIAWLFLLQIHVIAGGALGACPAERIILAETALLSIQSQIVDRSTLDIAAERVDFEGLPATVSVRIPPVIGVPGILRQSRMRLTPINTSFGPRFRNYAHALNIPVLQPIELTQRQRRLFAQSFRAGWPFSNGPLEGYFFRTANLMHSKMLDEFPEINALRILARNHNNLELARATLSSYPEPLQSSLLRGAQQWAKKAARGRSAVDYGAFLLQNSPNSPQLQRIIELAASGFVAGADQLSIPFADTFDTDLLTPVFALVEQPRESFQIVIPAPAGSTTPTVRFGPGLFLRNQNPALVSSLRTVASRAGQERLSLLEAMLPPIVPPRPPRRASVPRPAPPIAPAVPSPLEPLASTRTINISGSPSPILMREIQTTDARATRLMISTHRGRDLTLFNVLAREARTARILAQPLSAEHRQLFADQLTANWPDLEAQNSLYETSLTYSLPFYLLMLDRFPEIRALEHLRTHNFQDHEGITRWDIAGAAAMLATRVPARAAAAAHTNRILEWLKRRQAQQLTLDLDTFLAKEAIDHELANGLGVFAAVAYIATGRSAVLTFGSTAQANVAGAILFFGEPASLDQFVLSIPPIPPATELPIQLGRQLIASALHTNRLRALLDPNHAVYESMGLSDPERIAIVARISELNALRRAR